MGGPLPGPCLDQSPFFGIFWCQQLVETENDPFDSNPNELPWPKAGDTLFGPGDDSWCDVCLNFRFDTWNLYARGYRQAAQRLVESVLISDTSPDTLIYPIAFLYRHHLELRLKIIIAEGQELLNLKSDFPAHHRLDLLWKTVRQILEEFYANDPKDVLGWVENCLLEFSKLDLQSFAFRYPSDKLGNQTLKGLENLNVQQFAKTMEGISNFLEGAGSGISNYLREVRDMRAADREW
jgi:hypothetical protein